jgi:hypothetical protein
MKRREFVLGLGTAAVLPVFARAQQVKMPLIGYRTALRRLRTTEII